MNSAGSLITMLGDAVRFGGKPFAALVRNPVSAAVLPAFGAGLGATMASNVVNSALSHRHGEPANAVGKVTPEKDGDTFILFGDNRAADSFTGHDDIFERIGRGAVNRLREWDVQ